MTSAVPDAAPADAAPASPAPLLRVRDLGVRYEGSDAVAPASARFDVARGEVVLLLGPSGAGKSTLALALNGLIPHAVPATVTGTVSVDGLDTAHTPVSQLSTHVGMVFQDPDAQLVTGSVLDEVAFGPENLRLPVAEVLARTEAALRRVGLWDRRDENPDRLSGGGRQRLAIACALAMGSPLLVLDEPTANLDPQGIEEVYAALGEVVAEGDRAILLVEHNLDAATRIADRVVVLDHDGRTFADGSLDEVLRGRADELHAMGVWLPVATIAALRLRAAGWNLDPLPLDPDELRAALVLEPGILDPGAPVPTLAPPTVPADGDLQSCGSEAPETSAILHISASVPAGGGSDATGPDVTGPDAPDASMIPPDREPGIPTAHPDGDPQSCGSNAPETSAILHISAKVPAAVGSDATGPDVTGPDATKPGATERRTTDQGATDAAPLVRVRGLRTRRGRSEILHGIDLDIARGEFVAIVGANGAGKTTLLQSIAGVVRVPRGQVVVGGADVGRTDLRALSRGIGFVFQNPEHQFIAHTVFDELAHGLRLQRLPEDAVRARVSDVLRRFGLEDKADTHPFLLSGGQKRRLSVGTALVAGAPVLALDEPTFGQDRARADELMHLLHELSGSGTTILVVTHDMQLVTEYAHRTIVVGEGRIVADAPTADVFSDDDLLRSAGLRQPPLRRAFAGLAVTRLADLPLPLVAPTAAPPTPAHPTPPTHELRRLSPTPQASADPVRSSRESAESTPHPTPHTHRRGATP